MWPPAHTAALKSACDTIRSRRIGGHYICGICMVDHLAARCETCTHTEHCGGSLRFAPKRRTHLCFFADSSVFVFLPKKGAKWAKPDLEAIFTRVSAFFIQNVPISVAFSVCFFFPENGNDSSHLRPRRDAARHQPGRRSHHHGGCLARQRHGYARDALLTLGDSGNGHKPRRSPRLAPRAGGCSWPTDIPRGRS